MALPNPGMDAVPFTPLTAEFLDDMIENIESLADGSGLNTNAVTSDKIDWTTLAWQDWEPSFAGSGSMTFTPTSQYARYAKLGATIFYSMRAFGNTSGSAGSDILFTLPESASSTLNLASGYGVLRDQGVFEPAVVLQSGTNQILVRKASGSSWAIGADRRVYISGTYETN